MFGEWILESQWLTSTTGTIPLKNSGGRWEVAQSNQQPECTRSENEQK